MKNGKKSLDEGDISWFCVDGLVQSLWLLPCDLLIAKLESYGVGFQSLSLLNDNTYLINIIECKSIFINDMFLFISEAYILNFADDSYLSAKMLICLRLLIFSREKPLESWSGINSTLWLPIRQSFKLCF